MKKRKHRNKIQFSYSKSSAIKIIITIKTLKLLFSGIWGSIKFTRFLSMTNREPDH